MDFEKDPGQAGDTSHREEGNNHQPSASTDHGKKQPTPAAKIKSLKQRLEKAEQQIAELKDQLLRKTADFENFKKRKESEIGQIIANANADLITAILPVLDDLERSLNVDRQAVDFEGLFQGVELIHKNLKRILESQGVKPIAAVGQPFDPEKHSALLQVESKDHPSGVIVDEHVRGYTLNDRVLRHSQVLVSK